MATDPIRVDIISDVVCPWCIVGYQQLMNASAQSGIPVDVHWHPFELNPDMIPSGEHLGEHIQRKYGSTPEQSNDARKQLTDIGQPLGITFKFTAESRIFNTFAAHQLLHWAAQSGQAQALKLALFDAYFTAAKDISNPDVLATVAASVGLDHQEALAVLKDQRFAETVREKEAFWTSRGVSSVPTMVFDARQATSGAQGVETFTRVLTHMASQPRQVAT
ncbi:DsbA family oxidoreductase [Shimia sp.]|uniref:DsbA family oxidoreductase n=1 Tax=Shimia sp. TaxID=1954381 RepID=UPI00329972A8